MSESFTFFNEKLLADNVRIISWCPTADLVFLVSPENSIALYRTDDQISKLWSEQSSWAEIKIVAWKPNGKELVFGCIDGSVYRIDITYYEPKIYTCWTSTDNSIPINSLVWVNFKYKKQNTDIEEFDANAFDMESSLVGLSNEPPEEPISRIPVFRRKKAELPIKPLLSTETQALLFIGNAKGQIHIILNGIYRIGYIDIYEEKLNPTVLNISVPQSISAIQVLTKSTEKNENHFALNVIDTTILQEKKEQIFHISEIQTKLDYLLEYTSMTLSILVKHHTSYSSLINKLASIASDYILKNNDQATAMPEVELIGTLALGNVTETLQLFFEEYLTSQFIKQLETNVLHGYQNSIKIVCEYIIPACERIELELSKLLGFSLWTQRYGDFLEITAVEKSIKYIENFISEIHLFTKDLNHLSNNFKAFIKWITIVADKVAITTSGEYQNEPGLCEDPDLVLEFLENDFNHDSLADYFVSSKNKEDDNQKQLVYLLNMVKKGCSLMLEKPSVTFSERIKVTSRNYFRLDGVSLLRQPRDKIVAYTTEFQDGSQHNYYAFLQFNANPKLVILKNGFGKDPKIQYALFHVPKEAITDMEFLDHEELGICIQNDTNSSSLFTLLLSDIEFKNISNTKVATKDLNMARSLELEDMVSVKLGCNGHPKRRIMCVVSSSGLLKVYSMEDESEDLSD